MVTHVLTYHPSHTHNLEGGGGGLTQWGIIGSTLIYAYRRYQGYCNTDHSFLHKLEKGEGRGGG